jgi:hypothetical protein
MLELFMRLKLELFELFFTFHSLGVTFFFFELLISKFGIFFVVYNFPLIFHKFSIFSQ